VRPGALRSALACGLAALASCIPPAASLRPQPAPRPLPAPALAPGVVPDSLDFGLVFRAAGPLPAAAPPRSAAAATSAESRLEPFALPSRSVRVLVTESSRRVSVRTGEPVSLLAGRRQHHERLAGRIVLEPGGAEARVSAEGERPFSVSLPCTLQSASGAALLSLDSLSCRGSLVLAAAGAGLTVVNIVDIEEYLRGVVPLELGVRDARHLEALKAQAVAARTYACRKVQERAAQSFDVYATVADQVYGGAAAADSVSDRAIRETAGVVAVYGDSLIQAFYHSTCGGRTAAAHEVWDMAPRPYLVSVDDRDGSGKPWCAASHYAHWSVSWSREQLAAILARYGADASCGGSFGGSLGRLAVVSRSSCGRVARLEAASARGTLELCGDRVRFGLRRPEAGSAILPSSRFEVSEGERRGRVTVSGSGYGHGVGLCQYGALGRAAAGQGYAQILQAYYPGVQLRRIGAAVR